MDTNYDKYLNSGTAILLKLIGMGNADSGEKRAAISAFSDELVNGICDSDKICDSDYVIYTASIVYVDTELFKILTDKDVSYNDCEYALQICHREEKLLNVFHSKGLTLPDLKNTNLNQCSEILKNKKAAIYVTGKILEEDNKISDAISRAQHDFSVEACDLAIDLLHALRKDISYCRHNKIQIPVINNGDIRETEDNLENLKKIAKEKNDHDKVIGETDSQISNLATSSETSSDQWREIVELCKTQLHQIDEYKEKGWPIPLTHCNNLDEMIDQYEVYQKMDALDKIIVSERNRLSGERQYSDFFAHCNQQISNIKKCDRNNWKLPNLKVIDPDKLKEEVQDEKYKKEKAKKARRRKIRICAAAIIAIAIIGFEIIKYQRGIIRSDEFIGQNYTEIVSDLEDQGFTDVEAQQVNTGWAKENTVVRILANNTDISDSAERFSPDTKIIVEYSSNDRIDITSILNKWSEKNYQTLEDNLKKAGLSNVTTGEEKETEDKKDNLHAASVTIGGENFGSGNCYVKKDAEIVVDYYKLMIVIGNNAKYFSKISRQGDKSAYQVAAEQLHDMGFTNITFIRKDSNFFQKLYTKEGSVESISIDGNDDFSATDTFAYDSKIEITVHTIKDNSYDDIRGIAKWE